MYTYDLKVLTPKVNWAKVIVCDWFINNSLFHGEEDFLRFANDDSLNSEWENALYLLNAMEKDFGDFFETGELQNAFKELIAEFQNEPGFENEELMSYMIHFLKEKTPDFTLYWVEGEYFDSSPDTWEGVYELVNPDEEDPYYQQWEYFGPDFREVTLYDFLEPYTREVM